MATRYYLFCIILIIIFSSSAFADECIKKTIDDPGGSFSLNHCAFKDCKPGSVHVFKGEDAVDLAYAMREILHAQKTETKDAFIYTYGHMQCGSQQGIFPDQMPKFECSFSDDRDNARGNDPALAKLIDSTLADVGTGDGAMGTIYVELDTAKCIIDKVAKSSHNGLNEVQEFESPRCEVTADWDPDTCGK